MISGGDDTAQLIYWVILAGLIGAGVVASYRGRWRQGIRHALLWAALILVLVFGYANRDLFTAAGDRFLAALMPTRAVDTAAGTVALARAEDGHFHVDAAVNGSAVRMLIDTGASAVVLTLADAKAAGINPLTLSFQVPVTTANGVTFNARAVVDEIAVGSIVERDVPVLVARDGLDLSLLGMGFLNRLQSFTIERDRLILRQ